MLAVSWDLRPVEPPATVSTAMKSRVLRAALAALGLIVLCVLVWRAKRDPASGHDTRSISVAPITTPAASPAPVVSMQISDESKSKPAHHIPTIAEKRQQRADKEAKRDADVQAKVLELAAKHGQTTQQIWIQVEYYYYPERLEAKVKAIREQDIAAGGDYGKMWKRQDELNVLTKQLTNGMSLSAVTNLLGMPFYPLPPSQAGAPTGSLTLTYSPHPTRVEFRLGENELREWPVLRVVLDDKWQVSSWTYQHSAGYW